MEQIIATFIEIPLITKSISSFKDLDIRRVHCVYSFERGKNGGTKFTEKQEQQKLLSGKEYAFNVITRRKLQGISTKLFVVRRAVAKDR